MFSSFFVKFDLTIYKKKAAEIPAEPNIIHITMIWYLAAMNGDTPDRI
jgi:hypothetical protein